MVQRSGSIAGAAHSGTADLTPGGEILITCREQPRRARVGSCRKARHGAGGGFRQGGGVGQIVSRVSGTGKQRRKAAGGSGRQSGGAPRADSASLRAADEAAAELARGAVTPTP